MKFKYCFALVAALMVLLSLACVAASENVTEDLSVQDSGLEDVSAGNNVDLSVNVEAEPSYVDGQYNPVGSEVPWTITVSAKGGTAHNTQVRNVLSANLGYVSHNVTMGEYDPSNGIWNVGDLTGKASLTILTKLNRQGTYLTKAYATTDSNDNNMMNNFKFMSISTGSSKSTSNITETSDDRAGPSHNPHYASMINDRLRDDSDNSKDSSPDDKKKKEDKEEEKIQDNGGYGGYSQLKSQSVAKSVIDLNDSNSSADLNYSSDSKAGSSGMHADAILPYDYTKVPIIILALFLVILFGIAVFDKLKDKS